jgi:hypothetical protein
MENFIKKNLIDFVMREKKDEEYWGEMESERIMESVRIATIEKRRKERAELLSQCMRADKIDYIKWLTKYIEYGGKPTHFYDYAFNDFYVLTQEHVEIPPLYGGLSLNIIVPEFVELIKAKNIGHNNLYFMKDFTQRGDFVPVYRDIFTDIMLGEIDK